jgi:heme exporter protein A
VSETVITARGLVKRFGRVVALAGVDLDAAAGTLLALLGPNGAGKSTLLRLLAGLARPSDGRLEISGASRDRRRARGRVGYVAHASFLYPALTARENLVFAARLYGVPRAGERADALLAQHGLTAVASRPAGGFSRGMSQRLAIARALVHAPEIVLLDEPYTGLDRTAAEVLTGEIRRLREGGRTLVLVTHDLARAAELADAAVVLAEGRVVHRAAGPGLRLEALERAYLASVEAAA